MIVIDDALLLALFGDPANPAVATTVESAGRGEVFTTSSWYWRVARAVAHQGSGALSRAFAQLDEEGRSRARTALSELPPEIGLISPRLLMPLMAALPAQLNMLTAEAVAAALVLEAEIAVTTVSPLLNDTAAVMNVPVRLVDPG